MTDPIKALIAAAERFIAAYRSPQATHTDAVDCICALEVAIAAAKAAAEARPEPKPDAPLAGRSLADGNWPEDAKHENGNYQSTCALCWNLFAGHKRRVVCKVCATEQPIDVMSVEAAVNQGKARPETAAEPSEVAKLIHQGHEFLNASAVLPAVRAALRALEALAREVRR